MEEIHSREIQADVKIYALNQKLQDAARYTKHQRQHQESARQKEEFDAKPAEPYSSIGLSDDRRSTTTTYLDFTDGYEDRLLKAEQDLNYKDQELRMARDDHEIQVLRLQEELSHAYAELAFLQDHAAKQQVDCSIQYLKASLTQANQAIERYEAKLEDLQREADLMRSEALKATEEAKFLSAQKDEIELVLQANCKTYEQTIAQLQQDYADIRHSFELQRANSDFIQAERRSPPRCSATHKSPLYTRDLEHRGLQDHSQFDRDPSEQLNLLEASELNSKLAQINRKLKEEVRTFKARLETCKEQLEAQQTINADLHSQYQQELENLLEQERSSSDKLRTQVKDLQYELDLSFMKATEYVELIEDLKMRLQHQSNTMQLTDSENAELKWNTHELEGKIAEVVESVSRLNEENRDMQDALLQAREENANLTKQLQETYEKVEAYQSNYEKQQQMVEAEAAERQALAEEKAGLERLIAYYKESQEELRTSNAELKASRDQAAAELKKAKSSSEGKKNTTAELKATRERSERAQAEVKQIKEALEESKASYKDLKASRDRAVAELKQLKAVGEEQKNAIVELKSARDLAHAELKQAKEAETTLTQVLKAHEQRTKATSAELQQTSAKLMQALNDLAAKQRQHDDLTDKLAITQGAVDILKFQADNLRNTTEALRKDKQALENNVVQLKDQLEDEVQAASSLKSLNTELIDELERLKDDYNAEELRLKEEFESELAYIKAELTEKDQELSCFEQSQAEFERQIDELQAKLMQAEEANEDLEAKNSLLKEELEQCRPTEQESEVSIDGLFKKIDDQAERLRTQAEENEMLKNANLELAEELRQMTNRFEKLGKEHQDLSEKLQDQIEAEVLVQSAARAEGFSSVSRQEASDVGNWKEDKRFDLPITASKWLDDKDAEISDLSSLSFAFSVKEQAVQEQTVQELIARAERAELNVEALKASEQRLEKLIEGLRKAIDKQRIDLATATTERQAKGEQVASLTHQLEALEAQLKGANAEKQSSETALEELKAKIEDLEGEILQLKENLLRHSTSLNTDDLDDIRKELSLQRGRSEKHDEDDVISGLDDSKTNKLMQALQDALEEKDALLEQITEYRDIVDAQQKLLEEKALEAQQADLDCTELKDRLRSAELHSQAIQAELDALTSRRNATSEQSIMYNALKKAIDIKTEESLQLSQQFAKTTADLQEANQKTAHFRSLSVSLQVELENLKARSEKSEEELSRSAQASESLEQKLSDAEFQVLMQKNALKQKEEEINSLILHCEAIEAEVERHQKIAKHRVDSQSIEVTVAGLLETSKSELERLVESRSDSAELALSLMNGRLGDLQGRIGKVAALYKAKLEELIGNYEVVSQENQTYALLIASLQNPESHKISQASQASLNEEHLESVAQQYLSSDNKDSDATIGGKTEGHEFQAENNALKAELAGYQLEIEEMQALFEELAADCRTKDDLNQQLSDQLETASSTAWTFEQRIATLEAELQGHNTIKLDLSKKLEDAFKRVQAADDEKSLLEAQLHAALKTIAPGKRTEVTSLLAKNTELEKECRRLRGFEDHCDELEMKVRAMGEKVKVLLLEREDQQRKYNSLSLEHRHALANDSRDSKHLSANSAPVPPLSERKTKPVLNRSQRSDDSRGPQKSSVRRSTVFGRLINQSRPVDISTSWAGARVQTEGAEYLDSEMSSEIAPDVSGVSELFKDQLTELDSYGQKHEATLGQGSLSGLDWLLARQGSELRLYIESKLAFSSEDWRFNPRLMLECLQRLSSSLDNAPDQANHRLKQLVDELRIGSDAELVARNTSIINLADSLRDFDSSLRADRAEASNFWGEGDYAFKSSDSSLELSTYSSNHKPTATAQEPMLTQSTSSTRHR